MAAIALLPVVQALTVIAYVREVSPDDILARSGLVKRVRDGYKEILAKQYVYPILLDEKTHVPILVKMAMGWSLEDSVNKYYESTETISAVVH